jgi:hypothetical protein
MEVTLSPSAPPQTITHIKACRYVLVKQFVEEFPIDAIMCAKRIDREIICTK